MSHALALISMLAFVGWLVLEVCARIEAIEQIAKYRVPPWGM